MYLFSNYCVIKTISISEISISSKNGNDDKPVYAG